MTTSITGAAWRGERGEPLDPESVQFFAKKSRSSCKGCIFKESFGVCRRAGEIAAETGQPDCEERTPGGATYIYVLGEGDANQLSLIVKSKAAPSVEQGAASINYTTKEIN